MDKNYIGTWEKSEKATYIARKKRRAIYAGSFDPVTYGHLWVIQWGMELFDELIVAIGDNPSKKNVFSKEERLAMLKESIEPNGSSWMMLNKKDSMEIVHCQLTFDHYDNQFLVDYARKMDAGFILRGLRNVEEFSYEFNMARFNSNMKTGDPLMKTVWAPNTADSANLSSSFVRSICGPKYWERRVEGMVPPPVFKRLLEWQKQKTTS